MTHYRSDLRRLVLLLFFSGFAVGSAAQPVVTTLTQPFAGSGGLTIHPSTGDLYVGNFGDAFGTDPSNWGRDVKRVTLAGEISTFAAGFFIASGNDFAADGTTLLQVELGRGLLFRVAPNGSTTQWASGLANPVGVVAAPDGGAFVANCGGNTISRVEPNGATSTFAEDPHFNCPNGLTMDPDGVLYTVNFRDGKILRVDTDGAVSVLATSDGGGNGHVAYSGGRLFVADRSGHRILAVSLDGSIDVIAGSGEPGNEDGPALEATIRLPNGIAVSPDGSTIYVTSKVSEDPNELNPVVVRVISGVSVANEEAPAEDAQGLLPVAPNPSRGRATIRYTLPSPASVELAVFDIMGRRVAVLDDARRTAGEHAVVWDGTDGAGRAVAAGTYLCRLRTDGERIESRTFTLVR